MESFDFPIEKGHILTFARSLGEENPAFVGEVPTVVAGTLVAPPTFLQSSARFSPDNPMRPRSSNTSAPLSERGGGTQLHAEQHFAYHRPVVAGETLKVVPRAGTTWQKEGRRGGTLTFTESFTDYLDAQGDVVVTARLVGVETSQVVEANQGDNDE